MQEIPLLDSFSCRESVFSSRKEAPVERVTHCKVDRVDTIIIS